MSDINFKIGDRVKLPFDETGTIVKIYNFIWFSKFIVRIRKANFNKTNQRIDFLERQLKLE